jgi:hypothetical protein
VPKTRKNIPLGSSTAQFTLMIYSVGTFWLHLLGFRFLAARFWRTLLLWCDTKWHLRIFEELCYSDVTQNGILEYLNNFVNLMWHKMASYNIWRTLLFWFYTKWHINSFRRIILLWCDTKWNLKSFWRILLLWCDTKWNLKIFWRILLLYCDTKWHLKSFPPSEDQDQILMLPWTWRHY